METQEQEPTFVISDSIDKLAAALSKAQAVMEHAKKDAENPYFKSKYADLAEVIDVSKGPLSDNGLSVSQFPVHSDSGAGLTTILLHSSGQFMYGTMTMKPTKNDPQGIGSCLTYMRRYARSAVVGLTQDDDDGNDASKGTNTSNPSKAKSSATPPKPGATVEPAKFSGDPTQQKMLQRMLRSHSGLPPAKDSEFFKLMIGRPGNEWKAVVENMGYEVKK